MAKKKRPTVTKTQSVKEGLKKYPKMGPKELAQKLKSQGVQVSAAYVSTIKSGLKKKSGKSRRSRSSRNGATGGFVAISALVDAQEFVDKAGGVEQAREALDVVAKLRKL